MIAILGLLLLANVDVNSVEMQFKLADSYTSLGMYDEAAKIYEGILKQDVLNDQGKIYAYWSAAKLWQQSNDIDNAAIHYLGFIAYVQDVDPGSDFYIDIKLESKIKFAQTMLLGFWMSRVKTNCSNKDFPCEINSIVDIQILESMVPFCDGNLNETYIKGDNSLYTVKAACNDNKVEDYYFYSNE